MMRYLVTVTRPEVCAKEPSQGQMGILIVNESSLWLVVGSAGQKTDRGVAHQSKDELDSSHLSLK